MRWALFSIVFGLYFAALTYGFRALTGEWPI